MAWPSGIGSQHGLRQILRDDDAHGNVVDRAIYIGRHLCYTSIFKPEVARHTSAAFGAWSVFGVAIANIQAAEFRKVIIWSVVVNRLLDWADPLCI